MKIKPSLKFYTNKNEINFITFALLLLSDLFIAILLFFGLSQQISQFANEYEYFPQEFRSMLIQKNWVENNIVEKISSRVLGETRSTFDYDYPVKSLHPQCREIDDLFTELEGDESLLSEFVTYERLLKNYSSLTRSAKESSEGLELQLQIKTFEQKLKTYPSIQNTIETIFTNQKIDYTSDISRFRKIFALKRTLFDLIFLLPVLALFILWNRKSLKKESFIQTVISSHYIVVAFLPLLFESIRLVIEVIPKILLKTIYDFLLRLNLITIWYYAVLLISIAFIVFIIWLFHTKIFTREKNRIRLYEKKKCMSCNSVIDYREKFCPVCGVNLHTKCPNCGEDTINLLPFCQKCGEKMEEKE